MRLSHLLRHLAEPGQINTSSSDPEIRGLYYDSREVTPGGLFFALKGVAVDGHQYIGRAVQNGAVAIVLQDAAFAPADIPSVRVADARLAMSLMAATFYDYPSSKVPLIGVTGTNGKTTTTYLIEAILAKAGLPAAILGTINYRFADRIIPAPHTTPESVDLQKTLRELVDAGAASIVMEVSSHALEQHRVDGCLFDIGVFTNLTRDHLDYHRNMDAYLASKQRLFQELLVPDSCKPKRCAVVNSDDPYGQLIADSAACPVITYGVQTDASVSAKEVRFSTTGISGILSTSGGETEFSSGLLGRFNLYNILAACSVAVAMELPLSAMRAGIAGHEKVTGRLERVDNERGITVLVDYAHTDDALENVLKTLVEIASARIITVFGCGGDRDRGKRPLMGGVSGRYSDMTIITSDNPRSEDPRAIIEEIRSGINPLGIKEYAAAQSFTHFTEKGYAVVESRRQAIRLAVRLAQPGDIVLIAGKGHEDYQIIGSEKLHFDDREEAAAALGTCF